MFTEWNENDIVNMNVKKLCTKLNKRELDVRGKPCLLRKRLNLAIRKQKEERLEEEAAVEQQCIHETFREAAVSVYPKIVITNSEKNCCRSNTEKC